MRGGLVNKREIEAFARQTLMEHGMFSIPVDPVLLANRLGMVVSNAVFSESSISGMIAKRKGRDTLLVNDNDSPVRKRFTIAHEIGHSLLHLEADGEFVDREVDMFRAPEDQSTGSDLHRYEVEANQFAAALLMDADLVREHWPQIRSVKGMAALFRVSESAMGYRLSSLGLA
jgi:Zn-dependent peptidase ImmA (M78 family)